MIDTCKFNTEVKIFSHTGELECTTKNVTSFNGRVALESIFRTATNLQPDIHYTLSKALKHQQTALPGKNPADYINPSDDGTTPATCPDTVDNDNFLNRKIQYFCIGTGGVRFAPLSIDKPRNHETRLYNMVPFRCVPIASDLSNIERSKYRMRRKEKFNGEWYYTYYLKQFSIGNIKTTYTDGTDFTIDYDQSNPMNEITTPGHLMENKSVYVYYEFIMNIDVEDFKEYYKATNTGGSLDGAFLSEFGLVMANEMNSITVDTVTYAEVYNAELYSKVVHSPSYLDSEENSKQITYEIFS